MQGTSKVLDMVNSWSSPRNFQRNLLRLIERLGLTLPVKVSIVQDVPCKWRGRFVSMPWPVLTLSSWMEMIAKETNGRMLANGIGFNDRSKWDAELHKFWSFYERVAPDHEAAKQHIYEKFCEPTTCANICGMQCD